MKRIIIAFAALFLYVTNIQAQVNEKDINSTYYLFTQLVADAKDSGDFVSLLIYMNAVDKMKKKYPIPEAYAPYFKSIKSVNLNLKKSIVISLNSSPKSPGFTNKEIDDFLLLKKDGISLTDFNNFLTIQKLKQGKIKLENMNTLEIKNIEKFKKQVESIQLKTQQ